MLPPTSLDALLSICQRVPSSFVISHNVLTFRDKKLLKTKLFNKCLSSLRKKKSKINFTTKYRHGSNECVQGREQNRHSLYYVLLNEIEMDNKVNEKSIQAKMEYSQRAGKWKVVIKQAPSGLEEMILPLLCFCCQHRMHFNSK